MTPEDASSKRKSPVGSDSNPGRQIAGAFAAVWRVVLQSLNDFFFLLVKPDDAIPRMGNRSDWGFPCCSFLVFVLWMQLIFTGLFARLFPEVCPLRVLFVIWLLFPLIFWFLTWAGLRGFYRLPATFLQTANLTTITLFPLVLGLTLSTIFLFLNVQIGGALFIFTLFLSLMLFSESVRLIYGLERLRRIYFGPFVFSCSFFLVKIILWIIFSRN